MKYMRSFKEMAKEMYQLKPLLAFCIGRAADMFSTYLATNRYSVEVEINPIVREILRNCGVEVGTILAYFSSFVSLPVAYLFSKGMEKLARRMDKIKDKELEIWKDLYYPLLYGISLASVYVSINNLILTFAPDVFSHYNFLLGENAVRISNLLLTSSFVFYGYKIYKKLKSFSSPSIFSLQRKKNDR